MRFLVSFASSPDARAFRLDELAAAAKMFNIDMKITDLLPPWESVSAKEPLSISMPFGEGVSTTTTVEDVARELNGSSPHGSGPFAYIDVPTEEDAKRLASRCVLVQSITDVYAEGTCVQSCIDALLNCPEQSSRLAPFLSGEVSFKYLIESSERKYSQNEKFEIIQSFERIGHKGVAEMKTPDIIFKVVMQHDPKHHGKKEVPAVRVFFGREVAVSNRCEWMDKYGLKKRPYIGTTSMPPELCFLMANLAKVERHDLVYDPFCGTGSSLVAATALGAQCFGSDMDGRAMRAGTAKSQVSALQLQQQSVAMKHYDAETLKAQRNEFVLSGFTKADGQEEEQTPASIAMEKPVSMLTNFHAYQFWSWPERFRMNFSVSNHLWRPIVSGSRKGWLDAIMCDPPYGIREQKKKVTKNVESDAEKPATKEKDRSATCIAGSPDAKEYDTMEMILDLVMFAGNSLVEGGRLVYWHPTTHQFCLDELPRHPSFEICSCVAQQVSLKLTRVLVTMEKVTNPPEGLTKEACQPLRSPDDVRELMDAKDVPQHPSYAQYKDKKQKKWEGNQQYFEEQKRKREQESSGSQQPNKVGAEGDDEPVVVSGGEAGQDEIKSKRQRRKETALKMVEKRQANLAAQERRHRISQLNDKCQRDGQLNAEDAEELKQLEAAEEERAKELQSQGGSNWKA